MRMHPDLHKKIKENKGFASKLLRFKKYYKYMSFFFGLFILIKRSLINYYTIDKNTICLFQ